MQKEKPDALLEKLSALRDEISSLVEQVGYWRATAQLEKQDRLECEESRRALAYECKALRRELDQQILRRVERISKTAS
jgi:hypothetical protein